MSHVANHSTAFLTDFYEVSMLQAALKAGKANERTVFELFARTLPQGRRYGVVAGVARAIEAVKNFTFTEAQLAALSANPLIEKDTIAFLSDYSFSGTIRGYRDGDLYFPNSPIMTVEGTFGECVLLETVLLSILNHDSAIASAATRMVEAANGISLIEMGSRRTHEYAAVDCARVAYMCGFAATSNMEAGLRYGLPVVGTSAHAFTLAFETEKEAFAAQVAALGVNTTLLVDTYDTAQGIANAVEVAGTSLGGVRIDSGDLVEETFKARTLLDSLGAHDTKIVLSSDIDEFIIDSLVSTGAPVDSIGAGTKLVTGSGAPTASMVFKLVAREGADGAMVPVAKRSNGKASVGGAKTSYRAYRDGVLTDEFYVLDGESLPTLDPDLEVKPVPVVLIENGTVTADFTVSDSRWFHTDTMATLADEHKQVTAGDAAFICHRA